MKPTIHNFDLKWIQIIQGLPSWLRPLMLAATLVGQPVVVGVALIAYATYFWRDGQEMVARATVTVTVSLLLSNLLKLVLHRKRPATYVGHLIHSYSFPSGHAYSTMLGYGFLAWLAHRHLPAPWSVVVPVLLVLLIILVGISRVYLGAHYPTDVIGGWIIGAIVLAVIILVFHV